MTSVPVGGIIRRSRGKCGLGRATIRVLVEVSEKHDQSGFFSRLLGRGGGHAPQEIRVTRPTLTLSFDYERGLAFDDAQLADTGLDHVLKFLARHKLRATFNCVAKIAEDAPDRIRAIADGGHEVACHGYMHESPRDLDDVQLRQMLFRAREAFSKIGVTVIGFRSPRSHWDERLATELARLGFCYNAEHDKAHFPYVLVSAPRTIVRMPVTTDDWGYIKYPSEPDRVPQRHYRYVKRALQETFFLGLGYHPWVLAEKPQRLREWESLVEGAVRSGMRICPFADVLPADLAKPGPVSAGPPGPSQPGDGAAQA